MAKKRKQLSQFGKILTALMTEKKWGVRKLARTAKVSHTSLVSWKKGHHAPTDYEAVGRLADALGVSMSFLLRGKNDKVVKPRTVTEYFVDGEVIFDGLASIRLQNEGSHVPEEAYARIKIQQLIPRPEIPALLPKAPKWPTLDMVPREHVTSKPHT